MSAEPERRAVLVGIKAVHSAVFLTNLPAILWLVGTGFSRRRDKSVAAAATLVAIESGVFVASARSSRTG
jgi:hypothetical protein